MIRITILYDNFSARKGVKPAWGFAALLTVGKKRILFDTGGRPDVLLANMSVMKISPALVSDVFISHNHWDHAGGLFSFLNKNNRVKVYLPISFSQLFQSEVKAAGAKCYRIGAFAKIAKDTYSTGPLGEKIVEQALIVVDPKGLVVLTGCAHPGIINIIKEAKRSFKKPVQAVIGGFHLASKSAAEMEKIISEFKKIGVAFVAPCHCTGGKAINRFKKAYGDMFIPVGAGSVVAVQKTGQRKRVEAIMNK